MGIGGSATNDAGVGMAKALGFRFFDHKDNEVPATAQHLGDINRIDDSEVLIDLKEVIIQVACDVKNPMTGESGASLVYAQQKGAGQKSVRILEQSMKKFIPVLEKYCCRAINHVPGAGAAGGLGGGLIAFAGAGLENGFNLIAQVLNLDSHIRESDVILTAEGKLDEQSLSGKVPYGVMKLGKKYNKIVFGVAGTIKGSFSDFYKEGFDALFPIQNKPMGLKESISKSSDLLINTGVTIGNILNLLIKKKM
jgi:glycerate kinase